MDIAVINVSSQQSHAQPPWGAPSWVMGCDCGQVIANAIGDLALLGESAPGPRCVSLRCDAVRYDRLWVIIRLFVAYPKIVIEVKNTITEDSPSPYRQTCVLVPQPMSSSDNDNESKSDAGLAQEMNVGSAVITPPVTGASAASVSTGPQAARHGDFASASSTSTNTSAAAQSHARNATNPSADASTSRGGKTPKSRVDKTSKGELSMPAELTPAELATAVAAIFRKFDAAWYGPGQNPRSALDDSIAMFRELRLILEYAAAQLARCKNASAGGTHLIVEEYTFTAMRTLLQAVLVLQGEDTRRADAQSLSAPPPHDETPSNIVVGVTGVEPLWNLQRGVVKEILERLLREMRTVQGVASKRIDGFAQLIQHVVKQQLVFIFQRYAQTRATTMSQKERSAVAKERVATMQGQVIVGDDGVSRNGLYARAQVKEATFAARDAAWKATLRAALNRTPQDELALMLPGTPAEVLAGINAFATPELLAFLQLHSLSARVLGGFLPSDLQSMLSNRELSAAKGSFEMWQQQQCSSDDRYLRKEITNIWQLGRALSQSWESGVLKTRVEALVAADKAAQDRFKDTQFSDTIIKHIDGVSYMYQIKRNAGGHRTGSRWCVNSDRGRSGGWCPTMAAADISCFSDSDHPRPFSTKKEELVQECDKLGLKVLVRDTKTKLIAKIIQLKNESAGGLAVGKTKEKKKASKKRKQEGDGTKTTPKKTTPMKKKTKTKKVKVAG